MCVLSWNLLAIVAFCCHRPICCFTIAGLLPRFCTRSIEEKRIMNFRTQAWKRFQDQKTIIQMQLRCSTHRRSNTKCHFFDIFTRLILRIFHSYNVLISVQSTSTTHGRVICQRCRTKMMHCLLILSLNAWIMYQMWRTNTNWRKKDVYQLKKTKARVKINVNKLHHELKLNHFYFGDIFCFC